ncbi:hypothetical protein BOTBODRAFT_257366 [Botryobasidium botryosum FD-172 SS1]|uniref:CCHC-type domain-containing protein n=1 Tax=Botryobasidium botryosum (strain FD-172 SS1) TaxID=930990 RepID=A0A067MXD3_BOTB1|nr:hypothetical protein BOTBODRAFT_257366 [Botryobasidium botryosum FD-172 SS1]
MFTKHLCTRAGLAPSTGNVVSRAFLPRLIASSQLALVRHNSDWGRAPMRHEDRGVRQARCHNCGAVGHMSSSCPTRGTPKCYACKTCR